ncbi:BrnT family toxin [Sphingobium algorifonticola]|uniref:BrnT family toxin n=1 Tax=Sphingobium algorifonticola TaxID=2008318 RepID=A0A437JC82_9SPHN|nr:BrnT family toxin [Sphingobium algorifonticola]RVT43495.1 BrnT family toxin [Sphingobium algorifonticola]
MKVSFDETKRLWTLENRGLDFVDAPEILKGVHIVLEDDRKPYPEPRFLAYGFVDNRLVMFAFTPIPDGIRVFSMRKCNAREQRKFDHWVG